MSVIRHNGYSMFSESVANTLLSRWGINVNTFADWESLSAENLLQKVTDLLSFFADSEQNVSNYRDSVNSLREQAAYANEQKRTQAREIGEIVGHALKNEAQHRDYCGEYEETLDKLCQSLSEQGHGVFAQSLLASGDRREWHEVTMRVRARGENDARDAAQNILYNAEAHSRAEVVGY